ncbi:hypothetical protein Pla144_38000 [Bythopirellula polymerisocia]|uniref:Uncharacterized protein n=1 Tax=Bythopirellula polymerisocia TaxID=2528003 RepID=A0A5C6CHV2_9BACT|nr:hypothetical protein Pla144_38000 [Bythopirellula polymerisocia]
MHDESREQASRTEKFFGHGLKQIEHGFKSAFHVIHVSSVNFGS